jgi:hypothetical protein
MEQSSNRTESAIEWLMRHLYKNGYLSEVGDSQPIKFMNQAKAMEKEQIMYACNAGLSGIPRSSEQYYQETY